MFSLSLGPTVARQDLVAELFYGGTWNTVNLYAEPVDISRDRQPGTEPQPSSVTLSLEGIHNPKDPMSPLWGAAGQNTPIRLTLGSDTRFYGEVASWAPGRTVGYSAIDGTGKAWTTVQANGILRRLGQGADPLRSAMYRSIAGVAPNDYIPTAYWPAEDGANATQIASGLPGGQPLQFTGDVDLSSDATLAGSEPLPVWSDGSAFTAMVPAYVDQDFWMAHMVVNIPAEPSAGTTTLLDFDVAPGGAAARYRLYLDVGFDTTIYFRGYDAAGADTGIFSGRTLDGSFPSNPSEASFFGHPWTIFVGLKRDAVDPLTHSVAYVWLSDGTEEFAMAGASHAGVFSPTVTRIRGSFTGLDGTTFGHLGFFTAAGFNDAGASRNALAMNGHAGEQAHVRMARLCHEEDIPLTVEGSESQPMGPQLRDTLAALFAEIERTDDGILFEPRDSYGLVYRTGRERYNRATVLALDYTAQEIAPPPQPVLDDLVSRNDVTVKRRDGGSARAALESGPLSVLAPPDGIGRYTTQVDVNTATDDVLPNHAGWHLHKGTVDGIRYEQVTVDLDAAPHLVADASAVDIGDVITIDNLPDDETLVQARLHVTGYREHIRSHRRLITYSCIPAATFDVGVYGTDTIVSRYDSATSTLAVAVDADDTTLTVVTERDHVLWRTGNSSPTFPFNAACDGIRLPVSSIASAVTDTFTRTESNGWGTATSGQVWSTAGTGGSASDFSVAGGVGVILLPTSSTTVRNISLPDVFADLELRVSVLCSAVATGGNLNGGVRWRSVDNNNTYRLNLAFETGSTVDATLMRVVAGTPTTLATASNIVTYGGGSSVHVRIGMHGTDMRAKVWTGSVEPADWTLSASDATYTSGLIGCRAAQSAGNTNVNPTISFDNLEVLNPQTFTVTRNADGADKALPAGSQVRLWTPARYAL